MYVISISAYVCSLLSSHNVTDAATFRLLSDSFVPVARAFFRHSFTVLEYMKSVVV